MHKQWIPGPSLRALGTRLHEGRREGFDNQRLVPQHLKDLIEEAAKLMCNAI